MIPFGTQISVSETRPESVTIAGKTGHWAKVSYESTSGWAFDGFLTDKKPSMNPEQTFRDLKIERLNLTDATGREGAFNGWLRKSAGSLEISVSDPGEEGIGAPCSQTTVNKQPYIEGSRIFFDILRSGCSAPLVIKYELILDPLGTSVQK